jgi:hypothetical protein
VPAETIVTRPTAATAGEASKARPKIIPHAPAKNPALRASNLRRRAVSCTTVTCHPWGGSSCLSVFEGGCGGSYNANLRAHRKCLAQPAWSDFALAGPAGPLQAKGQRRAAAISPEQPRDAALPFPHSIATGQVPVSKCARCRSGTIALLEAEAGDHGMRIHV